jgi:hypothetical protein
VAKAAIKARSIRVLAILILISKEFSVVFLCPGVVIFDSKVNKNFKHLLQKILLIVCTIPSQSSFTFQVVTAEAGLIIYMRVRRRNHSCPDAAAERWIFMHLGNEPNPSHRSSKSPL